MDEQKNNIDIYNTLVTSEKGSISEYDIEQCINSYLDTLSEPNEIYNNRNMLFNGLLHYIYNNKIKYILPNAYNNDYALLDIIFMRIYLPLCYKYSRVPSIMNFACHLVNEVSITTLYDIKTGSYHADGSKVNINAYTFINKWESYCNSDLVDYIVHTNSIGGIFRAKTKGFREEQPIKLEISVQAPTLDTKQLDRIANTETPILPDNMPE